MYLYALLRVAGVKIQNGIIVFTKTDTQIESTPIMSWMWQEKMLFLTLFPQESGMIVVRNGETGTQRKLKLEKGRVQKVQV